MTQNVNRKAIASLRMVRIRRTQDRIAMLSVQEAQVAEDRLSDKARQIAGARQLLIPSGGLRSRDSLGARMEFSDRLHCAGSSVHQSLQQAAATSAEARAVQTHALRSLRIAQQQAQKAQAAAETESERRAAITAMARPKKQPKP
jgi:hypothetical protein